MLKSTMMKKAKMIRMKWKNKSHQLESKGSINKENKMELSISINKLTITISDNWGWFQWSCNYKGNSSKDKTTLSQWYQQYHKTQSLPIKLYKDLLMLWYLRTSYTGCSLQLFRMSDTRTEISSFSWTTQWSIGIKKYLRLAEPSRLILSLMHNIPLGWTQLNYTLAISKRSSIKKRS